MSSTNLPESIAFGEGAPALPAEREQELLRQAQSGDAAALAELHHAYVRLVRSQARRLTGRSADEDLLQAGYEGLQESIMRFDLRRPVRLGTFALPWVRYRMQQELAGRAAITLPEREYRATLSVRRAAAAQLAEVGREPSVQDLAAALNQPVHQVARRLMQPLTATSLEAHPHEAESLAADASGVHPQLQDVRALLCDAASELKQALRRTPTPNELASHLGVDVGVLYAALRGDLAAAAGVLEAERRRAEPAPATPPPLCLPGRSISNTSRAQTQATVQLSFIGWLEAA